MKSHYQISIIGGGLAGLTAAIHLAQAGLEVALIEKQSYPKHKVCGEYVSNEVLPYLNNLGVFPLESGAKKITQFVFSDLTGKSLEIDLPLGGFGMSRYALDELLLKKAVQSGVTIIQHKVEDVLFVGKGFKILTNKNVEYNAEYVLGAFGKRSGLDVSLKRKFIQKKSPWLAVKAHYKGAFPDNLVALHNFKGGYCGLSKVETNHINACYLVDYFSFKKYKDINDFQKNVMQKNGQLNDFFNEAEMIFGKPLSISQISFAKKTAIERHMLMLGDSAGLIHPLCGNGMAMAIHSAKIASETLIEHLSTSTTRETLEKVYTERWNRQFNSRMKIGGLLQSGLQNEIITILGVSILRKSPILLKRLIKATHGKPLLC